MKSNLEAGVELGRAIAKMYIAAQEGVSMRASVAACAAMEGATLPMRIGFNAEMEKTNYLVRALAHDPV